MPPPTRKRYIEYELAARQQSSRRQVEREAMRRWNSWTTAQRAAVIVFFDRIQQADIDRQAHAQAVQEAMADIQYALDNGLDTAETLSQAARQLASAHVNAARLEERHNQDLAACFTLYQSPQSLIDYAQQQATRCRPKIDATLAVVNEVKELEDTARTHMKLKGLQPRQKIEVPDFVNIDELLQGEWMQAPQSGEEPDPLDIDDHLGEGWSEAYLLYKGYNGLVTAYVQTDDKNTIIDRCVRKDIIQNFGDWRDVTKWAGDVRNVHTRVLMEVHLQLLLSQAHSSRIPDTSHFLRIRAHGVNKAKQTVGFYTDLFEHGTVGCAQLQYAQFRQTGPHLPEAFIWYVLEVLIECGLTMQYGTVDADEPVDGWKEVVHCDMKPHNIFLADPNPNLYPGYPAPKLADFGTASQTSVDDPANPELLAHGLGTTGFCPPEVRKFEHAEHKTPFHRYRLGAHTNVYQVGRILLALMTGRVTDLVDQDWLLSPDKEPPIHQEYYDLISVRYSATLVNLAERCMYLLPEARTTFRQLSTDVATIMAGTADDSVLVPEDAAVFDIVRAMRDGSASPDLLATQQLLWGADSARLTPWLQRYRPFAVGTTYDVNEHMGLTPMGHEGAVMRNPWFGLQQEPRRS